MGKPALTLQFKARRVGRGGHTPGIRKNARLAQIFSRRPPSPVKPAPPAPPKEKAGARGALTMGDFPAWWVSRAAVTWSPGEMTAMRIDNAESVAPRVVAYAEQQLEYYTARTLAMMERKGASCDSPRASLGAVPVVTVRDRETPLPTWTVCIVAISATLALTGTNDFDVVVDAAKTRVAVYDRVFATTPRDASQVGASIEFLFDGEVTRTLAPALRRAASEVVAFERLEPALPFLALPLAGCEEDGLTFTPTQESFDEMARRWQCGLRVFPRTTLVARGLARVD